MAEPAVVSSRVAPAGTLTFVRLKSVAFRNRLSSTGGLETSRFNSGSKLSTLGNESGQNEPCSTCHVELCFQD
jgi:hypothetical protein